jgi:hypothetical protein
MTTYRALNDEHVRFSDQQVDQPDEEIAEAIAIEKLAQVAQAEIAIDRALRPVAKDFGVSDRKALEKRIKAFKDDIKGYMIFTGEKVMTEGELGWTATRKESRKSPTLDLITMAKNHPTILLELATMGCLEVDWNTFKTNFGKSAAVDDAKKKYEMPGGVTHSLYVEPPK